MKGLIQQDCSSIKDSQQHPVIQKLINKGPMSQRNVSNIRWLLTDHLSQNQKRHNSNYQTKALNNPITQQNKIIKIPKLFKIHDEMQNQNNEKFQSEVWSQIKRKFSKPYSDCTKYIDNLSQHKALIRRGPFNIPLDKHNILTKKSTYEIGTVQRDRQRQIKQAQRFSQNINQIQSSRIKSISYSLYGRQQKYLRSKQNKKQIIFKSLNNLNKYQFQQNKQLSNSLHKYDKLIPPLDKFDKSIQNQLSNYKNLMKKQRYFKEENIALRNSVNKLVAIDLIKQKLNLNSILNKNNLAKLQKKFKKRKDFITKDQISQ